MDSELCENDVAMEVEAYMEPEETYEFLDEVNEEGEAALGDVQCLEEEEDDSILQESNRTLVGRKDILAEVFGYMLPREQGRLRSTCLGGIIAFSHAVQLGLIRSNVGCNKVCPQLAGTPYGRWFPVSHAAPAKVIIPKMFLLHLYAAEDFSEVDLLLQLPVHAVALKLDSALSVADCELVLKRLEWHPTMTSLHISGLKTNTSDFFRATHTVQGSELVEDCLERIQFVDTLPITTIGNSFLDGRRKLHEFDLMSFPEVTSIEDAFLCGCQSLERIDLSANGQLALIGSQFLQYCSSLKVVDLSPLHLLSSVGARFMHCCSSLESIDLSHLESLTSIGPGFLEECNSLRSVRLPPALGMTSIPNDFLCGCTALEELDLSCFDGAQHVGDRFLAGCRSLRQLNLAPLRCAEKFGNNFLAGCSSLTSVDVPGSMKVSHVGSAFMDWCSSIAAFDFSAFEALSAV